MTRSLSPSGMALRLEPRFLGPQPCPPKAPWPQRGTSVQLGPGDGGNPRAWSHTRSGRWVVTGAPGCPDCLIFKSCAKGTRKCEWAGGHAPCRVGAWLLHTPEQTKLGTEEHAHCRPMPGLLTCPCDPCPQPAQTDPAIVKGCRVGWVRHPPLGSPSPNPGALPTSRVLAQGLRTPRTGSRRSRNGEGPQRQAGGVAGRSKAPQHSEGSPAPGAELERGGSSWPTWGLPSPCAAPPPTRR